MKKPFTWLLLILVALASCREGGNSGTSSTTTGSSSTETAIGGANYEGLEIDRKFDYSERFLESLVESGVDSAILRKGKLILNRADTFSFPVEPGIFDMTAIFAEAGDLHMKVILERINYSTISYSLLAGRDHDLSIVREGGVHLRPDFYKTDLQEISTITGNPYWYHEYDHADTSDCRLVLRLGREEGDSQMSGRLLMTCAEEEIPLLTDEPITFRQK